MFTITPADDSAVPHPLDERCVELQRKRIDFLVRRSVSAKGSDVVMFFNLGDKDGDEESVASINCADSICEAKS